MTESMCEIESFKNYTINEKCLDRKSHDVSKARLQMEC